MSRGIAQGGEGGARAVREAALKDKLLNPNQAKVAVDQYKTDKYGKSADEAFDKYSKSAAGKQAIAQARAGLGPNQAKGIARSANEERLNNQAEQIVKNRYITKFKDQRFDNARNASSGTSSGNGNTNRNNNSTPPKVVKPEFPKPSDQVNPAGLEGDVNQRNRIDVVGKASTQVFDINSFRSEIINNDVLPSHSYLVTFSPFRTGFDENAPLTDFVLNKRNTLMMRCESIILPTPSLLEEENIRRYGYGPVEKIPYGVQFSDVSMTWLVDKKAEIIDFMHQWMNTIVMHDSPNASMSPSANPENTRDGVYGLYSPFEVGYKDGYANPIVRIYVYNRQNETVTEYEMYDVFPMNIQSMNLGWADENQLQKLTVNFAYTNMRMKAPQKTTAAQAKYLFADGDNPYEEKKQPSDKGGKAAADAADAPVDENITVTVNSSKPYPVVSGQTTPLVYGVPNPPSIVTRELTST